MLLRRFSVLASKSQANALRRTLQAAVAASGEELRPLLSVYDDLVRQGALRPDAAQRQVARRLDKLSAMIQTYQPPPTEAPAETKVPANSSSSTAHVPKTSPSPSSGQLDQGPCASSSSSSSSPRSPPPPPPPVVPRRVLRGLYIFGQVGTGKSMLMDLFFHHCLVAKKRRVHFHEFMLEVHARIHAWKKRVLAVEGRNVHIDVRPERNAITQIAREIASETTILCFDEFQVTDVADAIIMVRLFSELWTAGVVMVATSNRAPEELYQDGINRPYFLPFISLLEQQCVVMPIESSTDHRYAFERLPGTYYWPLGRETDEALDRVFLELSGGSAPSTMTTTTTTTIAVMMGRELVVPEARGGVCRFHFDQLCKADVFAADYKAIAGSFHTVILSNVPRMSSEKHNEARRFITLIDVLYEKRIRLIMGADAAPKELFREKSAFNLGVTEKKPFSGQTWMTVKEAAGGPIGVHQQQQQQQPQHREGVDAAQEVLVSEGELSSVKELAFAFQRAASRLIEMSSSEYQQNHVQACGHLFETEAQQQPEEGQKP